MALRKIQMLFSLLFTLVVVPAWGQETASEAPPTIECFDLASYALFNNGSFIADAFPYRACTPSHLPLPNPYLMKGNGYLLIMNKQRLYSLRRADFSLSTARGNVGVTVRLGPNQ